MQFEVQPDIQHIGEVAASKTAAALSRAIKNYGSAVWVLAGGTAPIAAYKILAEHYQTIVDWSKVTVLIGDERFVPLDDVDSNWHQIANIFLGLVPIPTAHQLRPKSNLSAEAAATEYGERLAQLPQTEAGLPRFDVVWLGVGEDGHTLSLFPRHPDLQNTQPLVIPVHNSPKPPADRISLTLKALGATTNCIVMAAGSSKVEVIQKVKQNDRSLPIVQATRTIKDNGGDVVWLIDSIAFGHTTS